MIAPQTIDLLELQDIRNKIVGTLPYGLQKRVELARALALDPVLLLLDEPTAGMNAEETDDMMRFVLYVKRVKRLTVVMIEHDMGVVMDISDRVAVLDFGQKIAEGPPLQVQKDPAVIKAYLGEDFEVA
jgi:branched-chain amino acid transport system ATP-binding protein